MNGYKKYLQIPLITHNLCLSFFVASTNTISCALPPQNLELFKKNFKVYGFIFCSTLFSQENRFIKLNFSHPRLHIYREGSQNLKTLGLREIPGPTSVLNEIFSVRPGRPPLGSVRPRRLIEMGEKIHALYFIPRSTTHGVRLTGLLPKNYYGLIWRLPFLQC